MVEWYCTLYPVAGRGRAGGRWRVLRSYSSRICETRDTLQYSTKWTELTYTALLYRTRVLDQTRHDEVHLSMAVSIQASFPVFVSFNPTIHQHPRLILARRNLQRSHAECRTYPVLATTRFSLEIGISHQPQQSCY